MSSPNLKNRSVTRFRTQIDPMIGSRPMNAFDKKMFPDWEMELTPAGVYVKAFSGSPTGQRKMEEHIVPFANIQSIKLAEEDKEAKPVKEEG